MGLYKDDQFEINDLKTIDGRIRELKRIKADLRSVNRRIYELRDAMENQPEKLWDAEHFGEQAFYRLCDVVESDLATPSAQAEGK